MYATMVCQSTLGACDVGRKALSMQKLSVIQISSNCVEYSLQPR